MQGQTIAMYEYTDIGPMRLHHWGGPPERFAVGQGPIEYITREEYERLLGQSFPPPRPTAPAKP